MKTMSAITTFEKLLDGPRDGALLRFGLGNEYLKIGATERAIVMFESALARDPAYSAAWKALGKTLVAAGHHARARTVLQQGIDVATTHGDVQAAKEMAVFLKRLGTEE